MVVKEKQSNELENLVMNMIEENNELKKSMNDLAQKVSVGNTTIQNHFNINVFLNEKCKAALNIRDFIQSLKIELDDLYYTKSNGLEKSVANIFLSRLKELGVHKRPIHCSDVKRQIFYIKDADNWEKDVNKQKLKKSIILIQEKHIRMLRDWELSNPNWKNNEHKKDEYIEIVQKVMCCVDDNKVTRELSKNTTIDEKKIMD